MGRIGIVAVGLTLGVVAWSQDAAPQGRTLHVGPGQQYARIADAARDVRPGDTVLIEPGVYREAVRWRTGDLNGPPVTIRGASAETTILDGTDVPVTGSGQVPRALFQIEADNYVVEDLTFRNARNGENGAGLRILYSRRTVLRRLRVLHNDMGIMSTDNDDLLVEHSEVAFNGTPRFNGYSHNFYVQGEKIRVQHSYVHDCTAGENFKAFTRYIELFHNVIVDAHDSIAGGEPTKEIGLQDSPTTFREHSNAVLVGNLIVKRGTGAGFIDFGAEGEGARNGTLYMIHNTVIRESPSNWWFLRMHGEHASAVLVNNIFYGLGQAFSRGSNAARVTGSGNWFSAGLPVPEGLTDSVFGEDPGFVNRAQRDYRLRPGAQVADRGAFDPTYVDGYGQVQAVSLHEPLPDRAVVPRALVGAPDLGAFEQLAPEAEGSATQSLAGRVTDGQGRPMERVLVLLRGPRNASLMTDAEGRYRFDQLPEGAYVVAPIDYELSYAPSRRELPSLAEAGEAEFVAPRLHSIRGRTTNLDGAPIADTLLFLSGTQFGWTKSDTNGEFTLPRLVEGGTLQVDAWRYNRSYFPPSRLVEAITGDAYLDFPGRGMFPVTGRVTDAQGRPLLGVPIVLAGSETRTALTNERGNFSFANALEGEAYTIRPALEGASFTPPSVSIDRLVFNASASFVGPTALQVAGRITDAAGNGMAGAAVAVSGSVTFRVTTAADGRYTVAGLVPGGTYTFTPSRSGFVFPAGPRTVGPLAADEVADFQAAALLPLSGRVVDANGNGVSGVSVALSGSLTRTTSSNSQGAFTFTSVPEGSRLTVRATRNNWVLSPAAHEIESFAAGQTVEFLARPLVTVSGRILDTNNRSVSGVTVTLSGPVSSRTVTTNSSGQYSFTGVVPGETYAVTPSRAGWTFSPGQFLLGSISANEVANFIGQGQ